MIDYKKIKSKEECYKYIANTWLRDPCGYDSSKIYDILKTIKETENDITFEDLDKMLSDIYCY